MDRCEARGVLSSQLGDAVQIPAEFSQAARTLKTTLMMNLAVDKPDFTRGLRPDNAERLCMQGCEGCLP